ncbi:MAG: ATP-binding protein [Dehalococcoidales bacterium]
MTKRGFDRLRREAEEQLVAKDIQIEKLDRTDLASLAHELAVHQAELEIQNEELLQSRKEAEEARDRYLDLYDFAPVGYFTLDERNRIIEANLTGCKLLGTDRYTIKNKPFTRFVSDDETDNFYLYRKDVLENNTKPNSILIMRKADGTLFSGRLESVKVGKEQLRVTLIDVTERRKIAEALERSEKLYHSLFENMIDGYAFCQMIFENGHPHDFVYLHVNEAFEQLTGLTNVGGKRVTEVIPGIRESNPELFQIYGRVSLNGKAEKFEVYLPALSKWFSVSVYSPQMDYFVAVFENITGRKQLENYQLLTSEILSILNDSSKIADSINSILSLVQRKFGIEAVGIRLLNGDDYPYFSQNGFTKDFLFTENTLSMRDGKGDVCRDKDGNISLECTCGLVLSGKTDPANPLFTAGGSAWTNDSLPILDIPADQDPRLHPRNRCIHEGFQSIALIPIRANHEIVGLLQLNDRKKNCFTIEMIQFLERLTESIGVALIRKQSEEKINSLNVSLAQRATELEAVNKELESFSYSVSHDLRAPLRSMAGFSTALLEDYSQKLDDEGKQYLKHIQDSSELMARLIDDLIKLSRVTRNDINYDKVNFSDMAQQVVEELAKVDPTRKVKVIITQDVIAYGDRNLLRIVLDNLIGNAWKFSSKTAEPRIEIGSMELKGKLTYFVRDNGIGFDMTYADKLFKPFQRLHVASEFPGTGIGLATVQRIIRRHGGEVWVESKVGEGATFFFTLG